MSMWRYITEKRIAKPAASGIEGAWWRATYVRRADSPPVGGAGTVRDGVSRSLTRALPFGVSQARAEPASTGAWSRPSCRPSCRLLDGCERLLIPAL